MNGDVGVNDDASTTVWPVPGAVARGRALGLSLGVGKRQAAGSWTNLRLPWCGGINQLPDAHGCDRHRCTGALDICPSL